MKSKINLFIFIIILLPSSLIAQWDYLGLGNKTATKIELHENELYVGTSYGFYKKNLNDNDSIWTLLGLEGKYIFDFIMFNTDTILVSTETSYMEDVSLFITYNNGANWYDYQNGFGGGSGYNECYSMEFNSNAPDTIIARAGACVAKSIDKGLTWQAVYENWSYGGLPSHFIFDIDPSNPGTIWAGGRTGFFSAYLLKSTDYGYSWQFIDIECYENTCRTLVKHPNDLNKILVGLKYYIKMSSDGGESWSTVFYDPTYSTSIVDMEISPNNNDLVYATGSKQGATEYDLFFLKSYDFGFSWDTVYYPSNNNSYLCRDLEIVKEGSKDVMYFATDHGVYRYSNSLVSVDKITDQNECFWNLYPNPMIDQATLSFTNLKAEKFTFTLQDIQGNYVRTISNITTNQVIINKDKLQKGLYIFQLRNEREEYASGKLIIN